MDSTSVEHTTRPSDLSGKETPTSSESTAPVMHTLQPMMAAAGTEHFSHIMQPPVSMPLMMSPYQMMVLPTGTQASQASTVTDSSRTHPLHAAHQLGLTYSQALSLQAADPNTAAMLVQASVASQDNGRASVGASPAAQSASPAHGSSPGTPNHTLTSPMPVLAAESNTTVASSPALQLPIQLAAGQNIAELGFQQVAAPVAQTPVARVEVKEAPKPDLKNLKPPKKPLTPYMRFSKAIWQQVKAANQGMSVCEIGATIGRMWRELGDAEKQHYNEDFNAAKVQYDEDLQQYLKITGLQASDLVKSKKKKGESKEKRASHHTPPAAAPPAAPAVTQAAQSFVGLTGLANGPVAGLSTQQLATAGGLGALPHFSQVWTGQQQYQQQALAMATLSPAGQQQLAQAGFTANGEGASGEGLVTIQGVQQLTDPAHPGTVLYSDQEGQLLATTSQAGSVSREESREGERASPSPAQVTWQWQQPVDNKGDLLSQAVSSIADKKEGSDGGRGDVKPEVTSSAQQYPSAHNLYNSYGYNPWSAYPSATTAAVDGAKVAEKSLEREKALEAEVQHLRAALSEQTKSVQRLEQQLQKAYEVLERLQQSGSASPGTSSTGVPAGVTSSSEVGEVSSGMAMTPVSTPNSQG